MNLKIPKLLETLIKTGQWHHPGDEVLLREIPLLSDPVDFCECLPVCTVASEIARSYSPQDWETFHLYRNGQSDKPLPWLNADKAVFIAVNRIPGDDVAIVLDFRDSTDKPSVVASCWPDNKYHKWFEVARSFDAFVRSLGLPSA